MANVVSSPQFTLKWRDFLRGLILAVLASVVTIIQESLAQEELSFDWNKIGVVALSTAIAYLIKNYLEPSKVITVVGKETTTNETAASIKDVV